MNGTLLFGGDRFGPEQDYVATYRALGGRRLAAGVVQGTIAACYETMGAIYEDPARCDSFPQVLETLRELPAGRDLPEAELQLLERVIAAHELGRIPDTYAQAITRLAATHRLGLVANILSRKGMRPSSCAAMNWGAFPTPTHRRSPVSPPRTGSVWSRTFCPARDPGSKNSRGPGCCTASRPPSFPRTARASSPRENCSTER